jgi:hypothetical protein
VVLLDRGHGRRGGDRSIHAARPSSSVLSGTVVWRLELSARLRSRCHDDDD